MLDEGTLLQALQRFADPASPDFAGWPLTQDAARRSWAHACFVYMRELVIITPDTLSQNGTTLGFDAIEDAFFEALTLHAPTAHAAAMNLADAWKAALSALTPGSAVSDAAGPYSFVSLDVDDVGTRHEQLRADLQGAFISTGPSRRNALAAIAGALHRATQGVRSTPSTLVVTYG